QRRRTRAERRARARRCAWWLCRRRLRTRRDPRVVLASHSAHEESYRLKILLVDDDADLLDVTAYSLRRERFAVIEASDGAQALHRWKVDRPDLVVLDLGLPRHDGFEVLQRIREKDATPILVLSGRSEEQDIIRAFAIG